MLQRRNRVQHVSRCLAKQNKAIWDFQFFWLRKKFRSKKKISPKNDFFSLFYKKGTLHSFYHEIIFFLNFFVRRPTCCATSFWYVVTKFDNGAVITKIFEKIDFFDYFLFSGTISVCKLHFMWFSRFLRSHISKEKATRKLLFGGSFVLLRAIQRSSNSFVAQKQRVLQHCQSKANFHIFASSSHHKKLLLWQSSWTLCFCAKKLLLRR